MSRILSSLHLQSKKRLVRHFSSNLKDSNLDVLIVGGGVVGTSLATSLAVKAPQSLKIGLVEAGSFPKAGTDVNVFSNRVSSYTPAATDFFKELGAWRFMQDTHPPWPVKRMVVWDAVGGGTISFEASSMGEEAVSWMIENNRVQAGLLDAIPEGRVEFFNAKVEKIEGNGIEWPKVTLSTGQELSTRLLIGADGGNSKVREFADSESFGWDYPHRGVVATLKLEGDSHTAWQRFLPSGPVAILPLAQGYASLVWSIHPDIATKLFKISEQNFVTLLNAALNNPVQDVEFLTSQITETGESLTNLSEEANWGLDRALSSRQQGASLLAQPRPPRILGAESRAMFPLKLRNTQRMVTERVALVGDAAHTIHPLAGQGLNLGIHDSIALSRIILEGLERGQDIGSIHLLRQYATERYIPNLVMMSAMDFMGRLFGTDSSSIAWLRSTGLQLTNVMTPLKSAFMRYASGR